MHVLGRAVALGMPRDALLELVRVFADATDRLADAVVRTFHNYVHESFRAQGLVGRELLEATQRIGKPMLDLVEPAMLHFHRRAYQRANREDLLRHLAEETTPLSAIPGEEQATVLFVDLASFTPLTATMGDQVAADVLRRFSTTVRSSATQHGGRLLKQIGDGFMLMFTTDATPSNSGSRWTFSLTMSLSSRRCTSARTSAPSCTARVITSAAQSIWPRGLRRPVPQGSS